MTLEPTLVDHGRDLSNALKKLIRRDQVRNKTGNQKKGARQEKGADVQRQYFTRQNAVHVPLLLALSSSVQMDRKECKWTTTIALPPRVVSLPLPLSPLDAFLQTGVKMQKAASTSQFMNHALKKKTRLDKERVMAITIVTPPWLFFVLTRAFLLVCCALGASRILSIRLPSGTLRCANPLST